MLQPGMKRAVPGTRDRQGDLYQIQNLRPCLKLQVEQVILGLFRAATTKIIIHKDFFRIVQSIRV